MRNSRTHILFVLEIAQGHPSEFFRLYHFPGGSDGKESACNAGSPGSVPGSGRSSAEGWQSTPVFLPGKSHGQRNLVGYSPWSQKVMVIIERLPLHFTSPQWVFQTRPLVFPWSGLHCSSPLEAPSSVIGRDMCPYKVLTIQAAPKSQTPVVFHGLCYKLRQSCQGHGCLRHGGFCLLTR